MQATGSLVAITGTHPRFGEWKHAAFVPNPLPSETPELSSATHAAVAEARASLASLSSSARRLPDPSLLRRPALRREAQSTSALEGTYAPLEDVLGVQDGEDPVGSELREIFNYVSVAEEAFRWLQNDRPLSVSLLRDLQGALVRGTTSDTDQAGRFRSIQVAVGSRPDTPVSQARYVPRPPGPELDAQVRDCIDWMQGGPGALVDPVIAAGLVHYQFEALHPFNDGNGRIGRLLVVLHLMVRGVLVEPSLTVSPWFESRRGPYYDHLLAVSAEGAWDPWIRFFADGLASSARSTERLLDELLAVQAELHARVGTAGLRAHTAIRLVDFSLQQPIFTVRQVQRHLDVTYSRANQLVGQLVGAGVLAPYGEASYDRRFTAWDVLRVILRGGA